MTIPRQFRRELITSAWIMPPYILVLNILMFGSCIFQSVAEFGKSFFYSGFCLLAAYLLWAGRRNFAGLLNKSPNT